MERAQSRRFFKRFFILVHGFSNRGKVFFFFEHNSASSYVSPSSQTFKDLVAKCHSKFNVKVLMIFRLALVPWNTPLFLESWLARLCVDLVHIAVLLWLPRCPIRPFFKRSVAEIRNFAIEFSAWSGCCASRRRRSPCWYLRVRFLASLSLLMLRRPCFVLRWRTLL